MAANRNSLDLLLPGATVLQPFLPLFCTLATLVCHFMSMNVHRVHSSAVTKRKVKLQINIEDSDKGAYIKKKRQRRKKLFYIVISQLGSLKLRFDPLYEYQNIFKILAARVTREEDNQRCNGGFGYQH